MQLARRQLRVYDSSYGSPAANNDREQGIGISACAFAAATDAVIRSIYRTQRR